MENSFNNIKIDKSILSVSALTDPTDDKNFWQSKTPIERLQHIEVLRRINYGHRATARLQRVLEFAER